MRARLSSTWMASASQTFSHLLHPVQATEQILLARPPLSPLLQTTRTSWCLGTSSMRCRGHTSTQSPHPVQRSLSCLLYTSDAADDLLCVDLGGRRIIKKKKKVQKQHK